MNINKYDSNLWREKEKIMKNIKTMNLKIK